MVIILFGLLLVALAFLGAPLFAIIGSIALLAFHSAEIDSSELRFKIIRIYKQKSPALFLDVLEEMMTEMQTPPGT